jgi:hypothetical protein
MRFLLLDLPARLLKGLLLLLVFLTPVLGVWLASSLVAYTNGPTWLAVCSGVLLFPLLPIAWDLWGRKRRQQKPPMLTWGDRVILRTLLLNLIFLTCLLALRPQTSFLALSTRGDWMLEGRQDPKLPGCGARSSNWRTSWNGCIWQSIKILTNNTPTPARFARPLNPQCRRLRHPRRTVNPHRKRSHNRNRSNKPCYPACNVVGNERCHPSSSC